MNTEDARKTRLEDIAKQLFSAYNAEPPNPWKTFDGRPVPQWHELSDQVRGKWIAAAKQAEAILDPIPF